MCYPIEYEIIVERQRIKEKCYWENKVIIEIDKKYFRPTEVESLKGDYRKAKKLLKWKPKIGIQDLVREMINHELSNDK